MPGQRDPSQQHTSITLPRTLVARLDQIAKDDERSRAKVIELLLRKQLGVYDEKERLTSNAPPLGEPSEEAKEEVRKLHGGGALGSPVEQSI